MSDEEVNSRNCDKLERWLLKPCAHLCIDMQLMFALDTDWNTPWMSRVLPFVSILASHAPTHTIFTKFMPPADASKASGAWQSYFERWSQFTQNVIDPQLLELVPELAHLVPPAQVLCKPRYSPFKGTALLADLHERGIKTLIISGAETDVCVLAAVIDAVDAGFWVVLPEDALCSSADSTHDALMELYRTRFSQQILLTDVESIVREWKPTQ
ncbi:cysteine hydrolase [Aureimonas fodinaquatilis]|uniref:Cysteine hydrolase n=1 Tax=Aureimonas fodinaquatilis TaxID=2565783 RepID=A0A5B0DVE1_9HYPH|nr:isochorismatase family cysteine hydrolase [Aureimonas fodinaquatilis]KAA0970787.1 cysteine hydrolase [Aureimonas fodinaquatilis]